MEKNLWKLLLTCGCALICFALIELVVGLANMLLINVQTMRLGASSGDFGFRTVWQLLIGFRFFFTQLALASLCLYAAHRLSPLNNPFKRK